MTINGCFNEIAYAHCAHHTIKVVRAKKTTNRIHNTFIDMVDDNDCEDDDDVNTKRNEIEAPDGKTNRSGRQWHIGLLLCVCPISFVISRLHHAYRYGPYWMEYVCQFRFSHYYDATEIHIFAVCQKPNICYNPYRIAPKYCNFIIFWILLFCFARQFSVLGSRPFAVGVCVCGIAYSLTQMRSIADRECRGWLLSVAASSNHFIPLIYLLFFFSSISQYDDLDWSRHWQLTTDHTFFIFVYTFHIIRPICVWPVSSNRFFFGLLSQNQWFHSFHFMARFSEKKKKKMSPTVCLIFWTAAVVNFFPALVFFYFADLVSLSFFVCALWQRMSELSEWAERVYVCTRVYGNCQTQMWYIGIGC